MREDEQLDASLIGGLCRLDRSGVVASDVVHDLRDAVALELSCDLADLFDHVVGLGLVN